MPLFSMRSFNTCSIAGHLTDIEETIIIVEAIDEADAREIAMAFAKSQEHEYDTVNGELAKWRFRNLGEHVHSLPEQSLNVPMEVFSEMRDPDEDVDKERDSV
jgi:hypothetical protein